MRRGSIGFAWIAAALYSIWIVTLPAPANAQCVEPYFSPHVEFPVGANPHGLATADFNEDGILDLAVAASDAGGPTPGAVAILLGRGAAGAGDGSFDTPNYFPAGTTPYGIAVGDFNEDGILDLAVCNLDSANLSILTGLGAGGVGNGTFSAPVSFPAGAGPFRVVAGDFNEDGILDLAVANNRAMRVSVLIGQGSGGVGDGAFAPAVAYPIGHVSTGIAAGDFNEDGITDLVATTNYNGSLALLLGAGTAGVGDGTFQPATVLAATAEPFTVAVADLDEDGILDLVAGDAGYNGVGVRLGGGAAGVGNGTFGPAVIYNNGFQGAGVVLADYNGDDLLDLASTDGRNNIVLVNLGNGDGTFQPRATYPIGAVGFPVVGGLFNDDEAIDLAVSNYGDGTVSILTGTCDGAEPPPPPSPFPVLTAVVDVPADQGGRVFLTWRASAYDILGRDDITGYRVWRRIPLGIGARAAGDAVLRTVAPNGLTIEYWEALEDLPAQKLAGYGYMARTTRDSLRSGNPYTAFFVTALTAHPGLFYSSNVDSGYSVDNLPPRRLFEATATLAGDGVQLEWTASEDADVVAYRVYRGADAGFACATASFVAEVTDPAHLDRGATGLDYYKLTAVDRNDNEGESLTLEPVRPGAVGPRPATLDLAGPRRNPVSRGEMIVEFTLPSRGAGSLSLIDLSGRIVARRDLGGRDAGSHVVDLGTGASLPAGLYLIRLEHAGRVRTAKVAVVP